MRKLMFLLFLLCLSNIFADLILTDEIYLNSGDMNTIQIANNNIFINSEKGILIFDISNEVIDYISTFESENGIHKFDQYNQHLFIHNYGYPGDFLQIYDISNFADIQLIGTIQYEHEISDFRIFEDMLLIRFSNGITHFYDLINPIAPEYISELDSFYLRFYVIDSNHIVTNNGTYITFYDASNFPILNEISIFDFGDYISNSSFCVNDNKLFACCNDSLYILNISDIANPFIINQHEYNNYLINDVLFYDNHLYIIGRNGFEPYSESLKVFFISDSAEMNEINTLNASGTELVIDNNYLYALSSNILEKFNIEGTDNIFQTDIFYSDKAEKQVLQDGILYICNGIKGVSIFNIEDINNVIQIGNFLSGYKFYDIIIEQNYGYFRMNNGLLVVNLNNYEIIGEFQLENNSIGLKPSFAKSGDYIFLGGTEMHYIYVIDISDPSNPTQVNSFSVNDWSPGIYIEDSILYIGGYWGGFEIYDISDHMNCVQLSSYPLGLAHDLILNEDKIYLNGGNEDYSGTLIFDVSNPCLPVLENVFTGSIREFKIVENYVYTGIYDNGNQRFSRFPLENFPDSEEEILISDIIFLSFNKINNSLMINDCYNLKIYRPESAENFNGSVIKQSLNLQNYPNPFNPSTTILFSLHQKQDVKLTIYNLKGQKIKTLVNQEYDKGNHTIIWNGNVESGERVSSGIYLFKLDLNGKTQDVKKCILLK